MRWVVMGVLVAATACASRGATCPMTLVEESLFCPRCQVALEPGTVDCATCDNPPVQAEVCIQSYYACSAHRPGHVDATECDGAPDC